MHANAYVGPPYSRTNIYAARMWRGSSRAARWQQMSVDSQLWYAAPAALDRYLLLALELGSKPGAHRCCCRSTGQTGGQTGGHSTVLKRLSHAMRTA